MLLDSFVNQLAVTKSLVVDSLGEELVEVEVVLDEEADVAGFELEGFVAQYFRVGEDIDIKGARNIAILLLVPLEGADANLKSVHARAVVLQLLIAVLDLVKGVHLVVVVNVET